MLRRSPLSVIGSSKASKNLDCIKAGSDLTVAQLKQSPLAIALAEEFISIAMLSVVATSMMSATADGRTLTINGDSSAYYPKQPQLFLDRVRESNVIFFDERLTGHLERVYGQLKFALHLTPCPPIPKLGLTDATTKPPIAFVNVWRPLCGEMRMMMLVLIELDLLRGSIELSRLLEVEGLLKAARYGGTPCIRSDGLVMVPGWHDSRLDRRVPVGITVQLTVGAKQQKVLLKDVSIGGAGLEGCPPTNIGTVASLELPDGRHLHGTVVWCHGHHIGFKFDEMMPDADAFFRRALHLRRTASVSE
jgi:hypothetical protein